MFSMATGNQISKRIVFILCCAFFPQSLAQLSNDPDKLLNWCIDSKFHKTEPGPESELFQQVSRHRNKEECMKQQK